MSYYEPQPAKKVYLYPNGAVNKDAKLLVVNGRQVRDFSTFLNRVTSGIRAPVAVRNIYTPFHGSKIRSLEDLVNGKYYVAGGSEQFKKVKYGSGPKLLPRRQERVEVAPAPLPQRTHHVMITESRYRRPVEKPFVIHVFRNGDELFHGVRVLLHRRVMLSWEHVLEVVTEKADLGTPAKKLCTLDGEVVTQLQDGGKYVAVEGGKAFRRVAYCATSITAARRRRNAALTLPVLTRRWTKQPNRPRPSLGLHTLTNTNPQARPQPPPVDPICQLVVPPRRKLRPMAGRKNKEARERALLENRDDSVFGGSPVMGSHTHMPSPPPSVSTANLIHTFPQSAIPEKGRGYDTTKTPVPGEELVPGRTYSYIHGNKNNNVIDPVLVGDDSMISDNEEGVVTVRVHSETESKTNLGSGAAQNDSIEIAMGDNAQEIANKSRGTPIEGTKNHVLPEGGRGDTPEISIEEQFERVDSGHSGHCASKEDEKNGHQNDEARESGVVNGSIGPVKELVNEKTRAGAGGKEGGVTSQINLVPEEEEEVEQNVDESKIEEVPEEEGVAERAEVKDEAEEQEMIRVLPEDVELESQPLQMSVDLTMSRRKQQQMAVNERSNRNSPLQSQSPPVTTTSDTVEQNETENRESPGDGSGASVEETGLERVEDDTSNGEQTGQSDLVPAEHNSQPEKVEREKQQGEVSTIAPVVEDTYTHSSPPRHSQTPSSPTEHVLIVTEDPPPQ